MTPQAAATLTWADKLEASRKLMETLEPGQWSQEKTAYKIGVTAKAYRGWVNDGVQPRWGHVQRAAQVFGWDLGPELGLLQQMGWSTNPAADLLVHGAA
jgi:DNA-binding XRE family transcriptional regulator